MNIGSALAIYFVMWWIVLFAVLPFGVRTVDAPDQGHDAGAPVAPHLLKKALVTTLITSALYALLYWLISSGLLNLDTFPFLPNPQ
jgi:predicted secreted protein